MSEENNNRKALRVAFGTTLASQLFLAVIITNNCISERASSYSGLSNKAKEEKNAVISNYLTKQYDINMDGWISVGEQEHIERCARDSEYQSQSNYIPEPPYKGE